MTKSLTERLKEIDTEDLENVLTFLYKEDARKYDLSNLADIFELYYFIVYFGKAMGPHNTRRLYLQMGGMEKMPAILQIGNRAFTTIGQYAGIKRFTDISIEDGAFYELYRNIYDTCLSKVKNGYVCYLRTYPKDKERDQYRTLYLAQERDFEKHFPVIMQEIGDIEDEDAEMEIIFDKATTTRAKRERMVIKKSGDRFDISSIGEANTRGKKNAHKNQKKD